MTARLAHVSDLHVDARGRHDDLRAVLDEFLADVERRDIDLILLSGDLYERRSTPEERTFLARFLQCAAEIAQVVGVRGNHDAEGDVEILNRLETDHRVTFYERPTAAPGSAEGLELNSPFRVLALPWIEKSKFAASQSPQLSGEEVSAQGIAAIRELLTCLRAEASRVRSEGLIPVLCAHVMLGGSVVSTGQMLIGQGLELSPSDLLDIGCEYAACGHIHATQEWFDGRVAYAGSPTRQNFGETEAKGYRLVTFDDEGRFASNEFVELPAREVVLIESDWSTPDGVQRLRDVGIVPGCFAIAEGHGIRGALVRFRYRVRAEDAHLADPSVFEWVFREDGAAEVQVEPIIVAETRARVPEIATVESLADKLGAYLEAKSIEVDAEQLERVTSKLSLLEVAS